MGDRVVRRYLEGMMRVQSCNSRGAGNWVGLNAKAIQSESFWVIGNENNCGAIIAGLKIFAVARCVAAQSLSTKRLKVFIWG